MVSFAEACVCSALEGEAKIWITLYMSYHQIPEKAIENHARVNGARKLEGKFKGIENTLFRSESKVKKSLNMSLTLYPMTAKVL